MTDPAGDPASVLTGLSSVSEHAVPADEELPPRRYAVALQFSQGVLLIEALPERDERDMRLLPKPVLQHADPEADWADVSDEPPWNRFIGAGVASGGDNSRTRAATRTARRSTSWLEASPMPGPRSRFSGWSRPPHYAPAS